MAYSPDRMRRRDVLWCVPGLVALAACKRRQETSFPDVEDVAHGVLLAMIQDWIGPYSIEIDHYREYLRWHAEHGGRAGEFVRLAREASRLARARQGEPYPACEPGVRGEVRAELERGHARVAMLRLRDEVLRLFSLTDAWRAIGYAGWPGEARGLSEYLRAPG